MLFTSLEFLLLFLPIVVIGYFILPRNEDAWNMWLLPASLIFYASGEPKFVYVMIFSIIFNFFSARYLVSINNIVKRKRFLYITVAINLSFLFVFKYLNFIIHVLLELMPSLEKYIHQTHISLPIGISFFTFQAMSYVIDVYRGVSPQNSLANFGLYVSFFPQLIAGPIVRYTTVMEEIEHRSITLNDFLQGFVRFLRGFNKKVLLSNVFSEISEAAFGASSLGSGMAWTGALAYTFQIFFDFSGYSDMAIGLGQVFGFHFMENFDYPYISQTITEFWRRWHMSLGSWFRDYVYFPLGGSRVDTKLELIRNLSIVWLLTGIWHGANWTFIFWGILYGVLIIAEKLFSIPNNIKNWFFPFRILYYVFTMLMVILGWVLFNSSNMNQAVSYIKTMFHYVKDVSSDHPFLYYWYEYRVVWIFGILTSTPVFSKLSKKLRAGNSKRHIYLDFCSEMAQVILFVWSVSCIVMQAHNPFIYFNF